MSNNVDITIVGDGRDVERSLDRMGNVIDAQRRKLEKLSQAGRKGSRETSSGFDMAGKAVIQTSGQVISGLVGIGSAATGILKLAEALKAEWEEMKRRQGESLDTTLGVARAVRKTRDAFSGDATLSEANLEDRIVKASERVNATPENIATALQTAFSAKGSVSNEQAVRAVEESFRLDPSDVGQATTLSGRALDVQKFSGSTDPRANLGFIQNVQQAARITTTEAVGANLLPAILNNTAKGDTLEQLGELGATLTQLMGDETGNVPANAMTSLTSQLEEFVPLRASKGQFKGQFSAKDSHGEFAIPDAQAAAFAAAKTSTERIGVLQESPELRRAFEAKSSFEKKAEDAIFAILRKDKTAMETMAAARETIRGVNTPEEQAFQAQLFEEEVASKRSGKFQQVLDAEEASKAAMQRSRIERTSESSTAAARRVLQETLREVDRAGLDSVANAIDEMAFEERVLAGEDPFKVAIGQLETAKEFGLGKSSKGFLANPLARFGARKGTEGDIRTIDEQLKVLRELQGEQSTPRQKAATALSDEINKTANKFGLSQAAANDPQVGEMLRQLKTIAENTKQKPSPPRQTERPTSRLSRGAN